MPRSGVRDQELDRPQVDASQRCNGRGSGGDHCCYMEGEVCRFLDLSGPIPRCSIFDQMPTPEWEEAPVGRYFARHYPGYTCRDWPQNIPEAPNQCCWMDEVA